MKQYLFGIVVGCFFAFATGTAQEIKSNTLELMAVAQQGNLLNVKLTFKEPLLAIPPGFSVAQPARVALDFPNTVNGLGKSSQTYNEGDLRSANIVQAEGRTRLVFNLKQAMTYEATIEGNSLVLVFAQTANANSTSAQPAVFTKASASPVPNSIRDIAFRRGKSGEARITVDLSDINAGIDIRQQGQNLIVDFVKVTVPETLRKRLDVMDFATPVTAISTVQQGANVRMTISPRGLWEHNAYQTDNQFVIEVKPVIEDPNKLVQGSRGGYQGEKLSLNFQNVEVRRLLQVIGEFTGMNMVVSDSVQGAITLILKDVPWDQALDIIMQQKGLDMRKNGNVILIAPREEIATKEKLDFESKAQIGDLEPLRTESYQMNYIKGADVLKLLVDPKQTLLSKRGSALLDDRSNMMFVKDTPSRLDDVREMIAKVDIPVRQVMIEARIVEAGDTFAKNLGMRLGWGGTQGNVVDLVKTVPPSTPGGLPTTTVVPTPGGTIDRERGTINRIGGNSGAIRGFAETTSLTNLPAKPKTGTPSTFGLMLFNSKLTHFLTAEISALESDGRLKVVSSPRVMTANQVEAIIEQGVEIPYQTATASGATAISFRKANLSLKVKPQITPDGKVTMSLDINRDGVSEVNTGGAGVAINTKHVKTEVLVENGGTVVIGGIYTQETRDSTQRIPFFGDLPYIGWLFKNREWIDDKTELLIFITPKIVAEGLSIK